MPTWGFSALFLQVTILETDLEARKEAYSHLEEENKNKEEIKNNFEMAINELNKEIIVSICFDSKGHKLCLSFFSKCDLVLLLAFPL